ncbi:MAG: hypothetical protein Q4F02_03275 [Candidatus Saccharibacteria bacterium]|nr:hypothetical protein [Candidatus Saccharibacteria bacterium]
MSKVFHFDHMPKVTSRLSERIDALADELRDECAQVDGMLTSEEAQPNSIERAGLAADDAKTLSELALRTTMITVGSPDTLAIATSMRRFEGCQDYAARVEHTLNNVEMPDPQVVADEALKENGLLD